MQFLRPLPQLLGEAAESQLPLMLVAGRLDAGAVEAALP